MVVEGAALDMWSFADKRAQTRLIDKYRAEEYDVEDVAAAEKTAVTGAGSAPRQETKTASAAQPPAKASVTAALPEKTPASVERSAPASGDSADGDCGAISGFRANRC